MQAPTTIAVAGATGRVGRHVVDVLKAGGHDVVAMPRSSGVDVVTGDGLPEVLAGVECVIDVATGWSPDQVTATEFFTAAARNLHEAGARAGVRRMVEVSIIGIDRYTAGYGARRSPTSRRCPRALSRYVYCARRSSTSSSRSSWSGAGRAR
jgi:nucleoside-diphosphate-sugar epimerase